MKLDFEWEEKELAGAGEGCESRKSYFVIGISLLTTFLVCTRQKITEK